MPIGRNVQFLAGYLTLSLTAGCVRQTRSAARVNVRSSTTAQLACGGPVGTTIGVGPVG